MKVSNWIQAELSHSPIKYSYTIVDGYIKVALKTHVPRGYYYSFLNDAIQEAIEHYNSHNSLSQVLQTGEVVNN